MGEGASRTRTIYAVTRMLIEELPWFPFAAHADLSDACARYFDREPGTPQVVEQGTLNGPRCADA